METTRGWKITLIVLLLLLTCSCRFKAPSTNEGQLLAEKGVFTSSLPGWVKPPDDMDAAKVNRGGLVPSNYSSPSSVQSNTNTQPSVAIEKARTAEVAKVSADFESKRKSVLKNKEKELSPLDRIESVCPGIEAEVTDALKTVEIDKRIQKYNSLTSRCSNSSDLWFWLGQDYQASSQFPEAIRAFEQVLVLDPKNQAAQALLDTARQTANSR